MHCKNVLYFIVLCISHQSIKCNDFPEFTQYSNNYITFGKPDEKFKVKPIFESLSEHVHFDISTNDTHWHTDSPYVEQYQNPAPHSNKSKYKDIPNIYMPIAVLGEAIGSGMEWLSDSKFGCFLSRIFTHDTQCVNTEDIQSAKPKINYQPTSLAAYPAYKIKSIMQEESTSFIAYQEELSIYLHEIKDLPHEEIYIRTQRRTEAFKIHETDKTYYKKTYEVSNELIPYLEEHSVNAAAFKICYGNVLQHQLHQEIIEIVTTNHAINKLCNEYEQSPVFTNLVIEGADLARELNTQGHILQGFAIADYCGWLNEAEYPLLSNIVKQATGMVVGTVEGGCNIVKNTYQIIRHPLDTTEGLIYILGQASKFLFHGVQELGPFAFHLSFYGTPKGYELHPLFAKDIKTIKDFYDQTAQELAQLPPEERARKITAFFTELCFTGKFMGQIARIKSVATTTIIKPSATALVSKLQLYKYKAITQTYTRIASTAASTQDIIKTTCKNWFKPPAYSYELVLDEAGNWRWVCDINPTSLETVATECTSLVPLEKAPSILNRTSMTEIIQSTIQEGTIELLPGTSQHALISVRPSYIPLSAEIDYLRSLFDKTREDWRNIEGMKKNFLKIDYEHILEIDFSNGKPHGLHHDYLGYYEENNMLELQNKVVGEHGQYSARARFKGIGGPDKTFFPQNWTRKQVIENILEAYDNFLGKKIEIVPERGGKYRIKSFTNSGMEIEMLIDQNCNLLSAYPTK